MQVQVKKGTKSIIEGIEYPAGVHEMPESYKSHWFFLAQVQNGTFVIIGDETEVKASPLKPLIPKPHFEQVQISQGENAFAKILDKGLPENVDASDVESETDVESGDDDEEKILPPPVKDGLASQSKTNTHPAATKKGK